MPRGLFITGTDTGVGKTAVGCALVRALVALGESVRVRKPVESGCKRHDGKWIAADADALCEAAGNRDTVERVCPWPLEAPLSPERAATLAGMSLSLDQLVDACRRDVAASDFLVVEGAGGFLAPLARGATVADLARTLALPVLLVVPDRLGCLNHAMLTRDAVAARGLTLAAVVLNRLTPSVPAGMDNAADLARWLKAPVMSLPYAPDDTNRAWRADMQRLVERVL